MNLTVICLSIVILIRIATIYLVIKKEWKHSESNAIWDSVLIILLCIDLILTRLFI